MIKSFLAGLTIGGVGMMLSMQYHLVRTTDGMVVIPRVHQPAVRSAYVDIRKWNPAMWKGFPDLSEAIVKAGREDLVNQSKPSPQSSQTVPANQESYQEDVFEQTRKAMEALVPIHLTRESTEVASTISSSLPANLDAHASQAGQPDRVVPPPDNQMPAANPFSGAALSSRITEDAFGHDLGLPNLQKPVPIPRIQQQRETPAAVSEPAESMNTREWMQGLFQSLIPTTDAAQAERTQGHAHLPDSLVPESFSEVFANPPRDESAVPEPAWSFPASPRRLNDTLLKSY